MNDPAAPPRDGPGPAGGRDGGRRTLGLIGGLGVGATVQFYRALVGACSAKGFHPSLFIAHADVDRVLALAADGWSAELAGHLVGFIEGLAAAGADAIAIPAVTPHMCLPELVERSPLPIISMLDLIADEVRRRGLRRVAVFGTRTVQESRLFGALDVVETVRPRPGEVAMVHDTYVALVGAGQGGPGQAEALRGLARTLMDREGVEAVILAGTEFALIFDADHAGFPALDGARLLIEALVPWLEPRAPVAG